ncbi:BRCA1-associated protein 2-domain-containing protein [Gongronella butleri]|nr:BRCA1-associated protein 2-domain-containing protein [Gongronella butleri]
MYYFYLQLALLAHNASVLPTSLFDDLSKAFPVSDGDLDTAHSMALLTLGDSAAATTTSAVTGGTVEEEVILGPHMDVRMGPIIIESVDGLQQGRHSIARGMVRLFRDQHASPDHLTPESLAAARMDEDDDSDLGLVVCVLAIPASMSTADFLKFVHPFHDTIAQYRILRDAAPNRYMAVLKFKDGVSACQFHGKFNGRPFHGLEPEVCHTVFVASIDWCATNNENQNDAAMLTLDETLRLEHAIPIPPHSFELPTCPICIERLDESITELKGFTCQHSFDCGCLTKWNHGGNTRCLVCRWSEKPVLDGLTPSVYLRNKAGWLLARRAHNLSCFACNGQDRLWICLICGHVGCGRYQDAHAFVHYEVTGHRFALERDTQEVWDYIGDGYVHRWIQNTVDGKFVEFPTLTSSLPPLSQPPTLHPHDQSHQQQQQQQQRHPLHSPQPQTALSTKFGSGKRYVDAVAAGSTGAASSPRTSTSHAASMPYEDTNQNKLEAMSVEYTTLLTSQLDSQRIYYEDQLDALVQQLSQLTARQTQLKIQLENAHAGTATPTPTIDELNAQLERARSQHIDISTEHDQAKALHDEMRRQWDEEKERSTALSKESDTLKALMASKKAELRDATDELRDMEFYLKARTTIQDHPDMAGGSVQMAQRADAASGTSGARGSGHARRGRKTTRRGAR